MGQHLALACSCAILQITLRTSAWHEDGTFSREGSPLSSSKVIPGLCWRSVGRGFPGLARCTLYPVTAIQSCQGTSQPERDMQGRSRTGWLPWACRGRGVVQAGLDVSALHGF